MTRYRIPHHMFLKWFVPYSRRGSFLIAALFVPICGSAILILSPSLWKLGFLCAVQLIWGAVTLNYHRRESGVRLIACYLLGLAILVAVFMLTKE